MMSNEAIQGGGGGGGSGGHASYLESSFDYRSLLPTTMSTNSNSSSMRLTDDNGNGENDDCCHGNTGGVLPALTWRERCIGCATCMVAGYLLSLGAFWRLKDLILGHPLPFVLNATIGNIIALAGSCFFSGPRAQWRKMFMEQRRTATTLYLGSLAVTLLVAFGTPRKLPLKGLLLLLLMGVQYVAVAWYCLSYIPFAHEAVSSYVSHVWARYTNSNDY